MFIFSLCSSEYLFTLFYFINFIKLCKDEAFEVAIFKPLINVKNKVFKIFKFLKFKNLKRKQFIFNRNNL